jgi:tRNA-splicing endonuclease subunit sen54 N-term
VSVNCIYSFLTAFTFRENVIGKCRNLLSKAIWMPDEGLAKIDKLVGGSWDCYGFQKNGKLHLYPEEALFLLETVSIIQVAE